jgi:hypothetical protein
VDSKAVDIDPNNFKSVQEVLDFIGCDLDGPGGRCNAITALEMAIFEQRNDVHGWIGLSRRVAQEFGFAEDDVKPNKYQELDHAFLREMHKSERMHKCERMLASSLYMMKDKREEFRFETLGKEKWGDIIKVSTSNGKNYHKIHFTYDFYDYVTILSYFKDSGKGFSIIMRTLKEDRKWVKSDREL